MGTVRNAAPVQLICAVCYQDDAIRRLAVNQLLALYGPSSQRSPVLLFDHTKYYQDEMGAPLHKYILAFDGLIDPMDAVEIKWATNRIEARYAAGGKRRINLDPGYLEAAKLILVTTKNFSHRIYLGRGIYGDVQLFWRHGGFQANPWTYPDYLEKSTLEFLTLLRKNYLERGT